MRTYAIMHHPSHNRVYFETSLKLSQAEFRIVAGHFGVEWKNVRVESWGGVEYLVFETSAGMEPEDVEKIFDLSFTYAFYEVLGSGDTLMLKPIRPVKENFVDESISMILKYTGKTNELFTRMMINVAYYSGAVGKEMKEKKEIHLLDPMAGKGTTLYEGLIRGFHVHGIEIGDKVVHEACHFLRKFLENAKYKFSYSALRISGPARAFSAVKHSFSIAASKEALKSGHTKTAELVAGNALYADQYYRKNYFDIMVGDLPYGVQHGNVTTQKQSSLTRNPGELVKACLPAWRNVLKPGGILVLAWNCHVLPRKMLEEILEQDGFRVKREEPYGQFEHRVDQAILRDMVVAERSC